jgi:hypothetical protein
MVVDGMTIAICQQPTNLFLPADTTDFTSADRRLT